LVVRVRVKLRGPRGELETSALVNTGFEAEEPELVIPERVAELLGLGEGGIVHYSLAGGIGASGIRASSEVEVVLLLGDRPPLERRAVATIMPGEEEVIISDRLASELRIAILDPYRGEWCLSDEVGRKSRRSSEPTLWR